MSEAVDGPPVISEDGVLQQSSTTANPQRYARASAGPKTPDALRITGSYELAESLSYRWKNKLLGRPLVKEELKSQRLRKPVALAILSSDVMSSCAYATEAMLTVLLKSMGVAAFALLMPITFGVLFILLVITASYMQVIKAYPKAGGAYIVTRDNFGVKFAQVAAAALLIDYTLTVAVSVAAGVDALVSAAPFLAGYVVELSVFFVLLIAFMNLRGIKEAGQAFAVPTFLFIGMMGILIIFGIFKYFAGELHAHSIYQANHIPIGHSSGGLIAGASLFLVLNAFSNGGTALTGTEAISNGVSVFRTPQAKNARKTLVAMALILGTMFFGVSLLATFTHAVPRNSGSPTVVAQVATYVFGTTTMGRVAYFILQAATTMILVLAANTSFTGFPFLASFAAADSFLPRLFTKRGHRLVFSSGIIVLTVVSVVLLIATRAQVNSLIALYAIGVFTGFTLAGVGMVKHHFTAKEKNWKIGVFVNGAAAVFSFLVDMIFAVTKFKEGAWLVCILMPGLVLLFIRLHRQYVVEETQLEAGLNVAIKEKAMKRHTVFIFVDKLDLATVRAIQYAKSLSADEVRAIHFQLDDRRAELLEAEWKSKGLGSLELEIVECPDRRLVRRSTEIVSEALADGETEVTALLPARIYSSLFARALHDQKAGAIASVISQLPHTTATLVPFEVPRNGKVRLKLTPKKREVVEGKQRTITETLDADMNVFAPDAKPIGTLTYRQRAKVAGRIARIRVGSSDSIPYLTVRLEDATGGVLLVFSGRKGIPGMNPGRRLIAEGMVGEMGGHLAIMNPVYEFMPSSDNDE